MYVCVCIHFDVCPPPPPPPPPYTHSLTLFYKQVYIFTASVQVCRRRPEKAAVTRRPRRPRPLPARTPS